MSANLVHQDALAVYCLECGARPGQWCPSTWKTGPIIHEARICSADTARRGAYVGKHRRRMVD